MRTFVLIITAICLTIVSQAQTVRTITEGGFFDDLFLHPNGVLYGSDFFNNTIWQMDTATEEVSVFRDDFAAPNGIAMNPQEELFICDHFGNKILKMDTDANILETYNDIPTPSGVKNIPGTNDMVFVEYGTNRVKKLAPDGTITLLYEGSPLNGPAGIAYIEDVLYVSNYNDRKVMRLENGTITTVAQLPAESSSNNFLGFIDSKEGFIYATSIGGHKIYKIDPADGSFFIFAGSEAGNQDGPLGQATFNSPNGILFDLQSDRLYISDGGTRNLRIIEEVSLGFEPLEVKNMKFTLYPNPSPTSITLHFEENLAVKDTKISITDASGKEILKTTVDNLVNQEFEIDVSALSQGMYLVTILQGRNSFSTKFLK